MSGGKQVRCRAKVSWAAQSNGLLLMRQDTGASATLSYPEAAIWDLLSRNVGYERVVKIISAMERIGADRAADVVESAVRQWLVDGWLVNGGDDG
ncbi:MAG: hypothetical protein Q7T82_21520 [Armatimonadota bacterium]|nr:hypothetical protein [Armatimonadota bacterium]